MPREVKKQVRNEKIHLNINDNMRIGFNQLIPSLRASAHTGVAIRPPEALINSEIKPGRWEDCGSPLPAADEGGTESPQPRHWRAVAQQAREWQCGKAFNGLPHQ